MDTQQQEGKTTPQTTGEKLVGLDFNPGGSPDVNRAKQDIAGLIDLVDKRFEEKGDACTRQDTELYHWAKKNLLEAQMMTVKFLTNRH